MRNQQMMPTVRCTFRVIKALPISTSLLYTSKPSDQHTTASFSSHTRPTSCSSMAEKIAKTFWDGDVFGKAGNDVCRLAANVPKVRLTEDQSENNKRATARWSLVQLIDWSIKNPYKIPDVWNQVHSGLVGKPDSAEIAADGEDKSNSPSKKSLGSTFGKISTETKAQTQGRRSRTWYVGLRTHDPGLRTQGEG